MEEIDKVKVCTDNRILYVEPNDIYENIDGNPLTPDYTDYCMYCNLIVEKTTRLKNGYAGTDSTNSFSITADDFNGQKGVEYTSFFEGASKYNYNYLTTDYSDIHFNTIKSKTFVESLQITGIDINYANRMSPMVTMQMVDLRGSGLFAREEACHANNFDISAFEKDDDGNIIDNIYSGFMSFPYPRYRLHIKGFYGRAVTYQLACSNFNGRFDASTGNFNITVTFIGYEYGCLQDLPLQYVVAAPYTKSGREYWDAHVHSKEWNLYMKDGFGNEEPMKLHEFFKNVKTAIDGKGDGDSLNDKVADTSIEEITKEYTEKNSLIEPIILSNTGLVDIFKQNLINANRQATIIDISETDNSTGDRIFVIFSSADKINITNDVAVSYNNLGNKISEYSKKYPLDRVTCNMIPNNMSNSWEDSDHWKNEKISIPVFLKRYDRKIVAVSVNGVKEKQISMTNGDGQDFNDEELWIDKLGTGDKYTFNSEQSYKLYTAIKNNNNIIDASYNVLQPYGTVIVFHEYMRIPSISEKLKKLYEEYKQKLNDGSLVPITSITGGISPYIGNYYKMVFCHVDTFIHTMWECVDDIYHEIDQGLREPSKLGVHGQRSTDVPVDMYSPVTTKGVIPPFPGIYRINGEESSDDIYNYNTTQKISWVGNVKGIQPWREETLINEYYRAIRYISDNTGKDAWNETDENELTFNLLPCFINDNQSKIPFYTREGMAYYVSIMSALVLGAMNTDSKVSNDEAGIIGAILAKKLFDECTKKDKLKDVVGGDNFAGDLYDIATIKTNNGFDEAKEFEFANGTENDKFHRIFTDSNDSNIPYSYMKVVGGHPIIPLDSFDDFDDLPSNYEYYNNENGSVFEPKILNDGPYVLMQKAKDYISGISNHVVNSYVNSYMFSVWMDSCNVELMKINVEDYESSGENIGNYTKDKVVKNIIKKYWLMEDNYEKYQTIKPSKLITHGLDIPNYKDPENTDRLSSTDIKKLLKLEQ